MFPEGNNACWDSYHTFELCCPRRQQSLPTVAAEGDDARGGWPSKNLLALLSTVGPLGHLAGTFGHWKDDMSAEFGLQAVRWYPVHFNTPGAKWAALDSYSKGSMCSIELASPTAQKRSNTQPSAESMVATTGARDGGLGAGAGTKAGAANTVEASETSTSTSNVGELVSSRWFPNGSNCKPHLHCPLWVPVAVLLIDRIASMSLMLWLAALDGRPRRTAPEFEPLDDERLGLDARRPNLWSNYESLSAAYSDGGSKRLREFWLASEWRTLGLTEQQAVNMTRRSMMMFHHVGKVGRRLMLPPHLCFTCCREGHGRVRVIIVRNPFARLVSLFRLRWLGSTAFKLHTRWEDFPVFVNYVSEIYNFTDAYKTRRSTFRYGAKGGKRREPEFEQFDLLHTISITEWTEDAFLEGKPYDLSTFHMIRVERLEEGLAQLVDKLCRVTGYCEKLPPFPKINSFASSVPDGAWTICWRNATTIQQAIHRYRSDFERFEYSMDPFAVS
eukprot:gnl/TRDRNA2_/TRDRNA2_30630_c0_seq2.p1 gnl/TRDRNA2_/TRDRNA2_30630_c0~~gnl/TRDRNA2_/TRDRNA2_30630_c0_seq2.p1  ORF type:complete len:579 (+),score=79.30 gnl/TRDRNA2_/TRDRNA2_30630_c0_seq2:235-1737(+)